MAFVMVAVLAAATLFREVPALLKKKWKKEAWIYIVFLLAGVGMHIMLALHVPLFNPVDWIIVLFSPVSQAIDELLGVNP